MRLLRDEQAYRQLVGDFVALRLDADAFVARFAHLWACDGAAGVDGVLAMARAASGEGGLYGRLDAVNVLCEAYACSLPAGCGYRVSEEQFRKEIESLTLAWLRLAPQCPAPDGPRPA